MNTHEVTQAIADAWIAKWHRIMNMPAGPEQEACLREHCKGFTAESFNLVDVLAACKERLHRELQKLDLKKRR